MAYELIVIGTSLGGLHALELLLPGLPKNFPVPVAIVQHRHKSSNDNTLSSLLQRYSHLMVKDTEDKEALAPGTIYLAPADYHLLIEAGQPPENRPYLALSTDVPVIYSRPSIDVLFESAADAYGDQVIGVILTGANHDGAKGLAKIKARGGLTVVQDPATAESRIMPQAAIATGAINWILPLDKIAALLGNLCQPVLR